MILDDFKKMLAWWQKTHERSRYTLLVADFRQDVIFENQWYQRILSSISPYGYLIGVDFLYSLRRNYVKKKRISLLVFEIWYEGRGKCRG